MWGSTPNLIQERKKAGLESARGRKGGTTQVLSDKHKKEIKTLAADPQHRILILRRGIKSADRRVIRP